MDKTPIWLLDVDGVINALANDTRNAYKRADCVANGRSWPIQYRPAVVDFINRISESGLAKVIWMTTWGASANGDLACQLGLPQFDVAGECPAWHGKRWWKFDLLLAHPEWDDRPIVWTDDDLTYSRDAVEWVREQHGRVLAIAPRSHFGLSDESLAMIEEFVTPDAGAELDS